MSQIGELIKRNQTSSEVQDESGGKSEPSLSVAVVTCMDTRINPVKVLHLRHGEVHVMRNAGATVTEDMVRSLAISQVALGTREIMWIKHTQCGLGKADEASLRNALKDASGCEMPGPLGTFTDLEEAVRKDVVKIRGSEEIPYTDQVRGFVLDVDTGLLREIS